VIVVPLKEALSHGRGRTDTAEVIGHAVRPYACLAPSCRDVKEVHAERGIQVSYESVRRWVHRFDELVRIVGEQCYLRGAVGEHGKVPDVWCRSAGVRKPLNTPSAGCWLSQRRHRSGPSPMGWPATG
jgi:hypothetical protein